MEQVAASGFSVLELPVFYVTPHYLVFGVITKKE